MIDHFTVVLPHFLMAIAIWRLVRNDALDFDPILPGSQESLTRQKQGFGAAKPRTGRANRQADETTERA